MHANLIDGVHFPYTYPYTKETAKTVRDFEQKVGGGALQAVKDPRNPNQMIYEVSGVVKIVHDPLCLNYWHVEMHTIAFNTAEVKQGGVPWKEDFFKSVMKHVIKANAYASVDNIATFDKAMYIN